VGCGPDGRGAEGSLSHPHPSPTTRTSLEYHRRAGKQPGRPPARACAWSSRDA